MSVNVDAILDAFNRHQVDALLIGGMNFLLRHQPVTTFDVDLWVNDTDENLLRVAETLRDLDGQWGKDEKSWGPVPADQNWLRTQTVFCFTTKHGAVDIFRVVRGLEGLYSQCVARGQRGETANGIAYLALSDEDMLACQLALPENERRLDRVTYLQKQLRPRP